MDYPACHLRCNGVMNCQQLDALIKVLESQKGREETIFFYRGMLSRSFKHCPLMKLEQKMVSSMY